MQQVQCTWCASLVLFVYFLNLFMGLFGLHSTRFIKLNNTLILHALVAVQLDFRHSQCFANRTRRQSRLVRFATSMHVALLLMHEEMCIISIIAAQMVMLSRIAKNSIRFDSDSLVTFLPEVRFDSDSELFWFEEKKVGICPCNKRCRRGQISLTYHTIPCIKETTKSKREYGTLFAPFFITVFYSRKWRNKKAQRKKKERKKVCVISFILVVIISV